MPGNGGEESLFSRLKKAQVGCAINRQQKFLPLDVLENEITETNIEIALGKETKFTAMKKKLHIRSASEHQMSRKTVDQAKRVFAVLVLIGEPDAMKKLLADGLTDEHLPLHLDDDGTTLVSQKGKNWRSFATSMVEQRASQFVEEQWAVLAPTLDGSGKHVELDPKCPFPFEHTKEVGHTNSSTVHKIKLHPAHCNIPDLSVNLDYVAAKEFWEKPKFLKEKDNLETIADLNHSHLIKHLATFTKDTTYYVIFPWADGGSLRDFWTREDSRVRDTKLTIWCLRQMLGIAQAIEALHGVNCRHGDVKPENILLFGDADGGRLVVADVGVSRTHDKATYMRHVGTTTTATTPDYQAPETFDSTSPRARRYDVWSVGCIFLEFTLWILHDVETINTFGRARHSPNFEFYLKSVGTSVSNKNTVVHPAVANALKRLRQDPRCKGSTIFEDFLIFIEQRLLRVEVETRAEAHELVAKLSTIVKDAQMNPIRLLNNIAATEKLRFPPRAQTGALEPVKDSIPEGSVA